MLAAKMFLLIAYQQAEPEMFQRLTAVSQIATLERCRVQILYLLTENQRKKLVIQLIVAVLKLLVAKMFL